MTTAICVLETKAQKIANKKENNMRTSGTNIKELGKLGINIELSKESGLSSINVKEIIKIVVENNKQIAIHAGPHSTTSLKEFIKLGNENVTLIF